MDVLERDIISAALLLESKQTYLCMERCIGLNRRHGSECVFSEYFPMTLHTPSIRQLHTKYHADIICEQKRLISIDEKDAKCWCGIPYKKMKTLPEIIRHVENWHHHFNYVCRVCFKIELKVREIGNFKCRRCVDGNEEEFKEDDIQDDIDFEHIFQFIEK